MQALTPSGSVVRIGVFTILAAVTGLAEIRAQASVQAPRLPLVVLAYPDDTFLPLAREIAASEGAPLAATPREALSLRPDTIVWVASPSKLSDRALVEYGLAAAGAGAMPALGFITGSSLERARSLYGRSLSGGAPTIALVSGNWRGHREMIRYVGATPEHEEPLNASTFRRALEVADGLFYSGHGGPGHLRFNESVTFVPDGMPPRVPRLVATHACNTLRPWTRGSIAMAFTDAGAAAYVGYAYSPLPGFQITDAFPFRHTWPDFPIGRLVQVQSAASMRGLFALPAYHLLGNPRLSVRQSPPYRVVTDRRSAGERIIELADAPRDVLPVRIDGGAVFETTQVGGVGRAWRRDPFYNGRLQVLDVGPDRYLLLQHAGGPLTIRLSMDRPLLATAGRTVLSGLDLCLIVFPAGDRSPSSAAFVTLGFAGIAWWLLRRKPGTRKAIVALALGGFFAACHAGYAVHRATRLDVVSSFDAQLRAWMFAATWSLVSCGALGYAVSRTWKGRVAGVAVGVLNVACMAVFWLAWPAVFNWMVGERLGAPLYNVRTGLLALIGAAAIASLCAAAFFITNSDTFHRKLEAGNTEAA